MKVYRTASVLIARVCMHVCVCVCAGGGGGTQEAFKLVLYHNNQCVFHLCKTDETAHPVD